MILASLEQIRNKLDNHIFAVTNGGQNNVAIEDIARMENAGGGAGEEEVTNKIIITLANIEEENILKNNYPMREQGGALIATKPVLFLNLYILISARFQVYSEALKAISHVLGFFQANQTLTFPLPNQSALCTLTFNLHNISLENLNNLWVVMGGKYLPSVLYKVKLIVVQESLGDGARAILEINSNEKLS